MCCETTDVVENGELFAATDNKIVLWRTRLGIRNAVNITPKIKQKIATIDRTCIKLQKLKYLLTVYQGTRGIIVIRNFSTKSMLGRVGNDHIVNLYFLHHHFENPHNFVSKLQ